MPLSIASRIRALENLSVAHLRERWRELYGEETTQRHRRYLIKRLAWKIQEQHFGGLDDETKARIEGLRREFENSPPETWLAGGRARKTRKTEKRPRGIRDPRLPEPGTVLTRRYKGVEVAVNVLDTGFEYRSQVYRSLSAIAREITGSHWNGLLFFGLTKGGAS